ncbi:DUF2806 domain-containing protein [Methylobacterium fujisawaense]|uniref:DUF2806 domain-containing protein n=1 Tax=Methylobacterium fujisawaense TaxID=107400 RepID=UPI00313DE26E
MPENLPVPTSGGWFAEWIANGKIPGATKAIAQLIGDTANAGSAWVNIITVKGEQVQQRIKTDTEGSKAFMDALAAEAARQGVSDPALVALAMQQFGSSTIRKHLNKVAVTKEAVEDLNSGKPIDEKIPDVDEDWLNKFETLAADASSERLQKLLGRVLSGEIRRPGAYSFATLNFISLLDVNVGTSISILAPYIIENDYIPFMNRFDFTDKYEHYMSLKDYGLIGDSIRRKFLTPNKINILFRLRGHGVMLKEIASPETSVDLMPLTRVGKEIFPLIDTIVTQKHLSETADQAFQHTSCAGVSIGPIEAVGEHGERFFPLEERMREQQPSPSAPAQ